MISWFKQDSFVQHPSTFKAEYNQRHNKPNGLHKYGPNIKHKITDMNFEDNNTNGDKDNTELQ